ncbi:MAG TPA: hypothetical protein VIN60_07155 [Anaerolineales bacterium]
MKKLTLLISFFVFFLASCTPEYIPTPPTVVPVSTAVAENTNTPMPTNALLETPTPPELNPAQQSAIASLSSTLNLPADQIKLVSAVAVIWPNGCMGVQRMGVMCTDQQVSGFVVVLEAKGKQYEFHTNRDGSEILPAGGIQPSGSAQDAVKNHLASALGINAEQIKVVSDAEVEWPDSCLGVAQAGAMCAMVVMPGHLIILQANDMEYEFHTNNDGSQIQPATLALTWKRSGGIAGFCDSLTVYLSGEASGNNCKANIRTGNLLPAELTQLDAWITQFDQSHLDASDPVGVSDRMTRQLVLFGRGANQPSGADQQALFNWAQNLYQRIYK